MALNIKTKKYRATFLEGLLATNPNDSAVHETYVANKRAEGAAKDEIDAEAEALRRVENLEKGKTIFSRNSKGQPIIWDYQIKGYLKSAFKALRRDKSTDCSKMAAYRGVIDCNVFVSPRQIVLNIPEGETIGTCERPLRAETMQGPRVALASSEEAPAGTTIEFFVQTIGSDDMLEKALTECWDYAQLSFLGAWRSSGKGKAIVECLDAADAEKSEKKGRKASKNKAA